MLNDTYLSTIKKKTQQFFSTVTSTVVFDKVAHMSVIHKAK